jgi:hypothetical protein
LVCWPQQGNEGIELINLIELIELATFVTFPSFEPTAPDAVPGQKGGASKDAESRRERGSSSSPWKKLAGRKNGHNSSDGSTARRRSRRAGFTR